MWRWFVCLFRLRLWLPFHLYVYLRLEIFSSYIYGYWSLQVPETPLWLLSKKRDDEALMSLQWLRGWVSPKAVESEFNEMKRYSENSNSCVACQKGSVKCLHPPANVREKFKELSRKRTLRPFAIIMFCFAISQLSGMTSIRPYMVQIFKAYAMPIDANWATVCCNNCNLNFDLFYYLNWFMHTGCGWRNGFAGQHRMHERR